MMDGCVVFTSCLFILVAIYAARAGLRLYSYAWLMLCLTSVLVHIYNTARVLDKLSIYSVVAFGMYYYIAQVKQNQMYKVIPVLCFVACVVGFYCFPRIIHHAWIHAFSMIGHLVIIHNYKNHTHEIKKS